MKRLLIGLFLIFNFGFTQIVPDTSKMTMTEKMLWKLLSANEGFVCDAYLLNE